ncbi:MAG: glycosyltransferase [Gemmatimonadaceae bacterium]|nr:glycosyltransferase [Gemmatimonadaceae bacterium]
MARIVIGCWGSHGDVDPSIGLGLGLQARGHDVVIATIPYFEAHVRDAGLRFHAIRPDVRPDDAALVAKIMDRDRGTEFLMREIIFPGIETMYADLDAAAVGADLLISHPLTMPIPMIAARRGIPWASTVLAPMSFFSASDLPVVPPAPWLKSLETLGPWFGRGFASLVRWASDQWAAPLHAFRAQLGLPRIANPLFDGQHSPRLVLALYSRLLGAPQPDWPANVVITGHMFHDATHGTALAPDVEAFLSDGAPPILFTLGSSAVLSPGRFWTESLAAVQALGRRAVFLMGPGGPTAFGAPLPPSVLAFEFAPHSLLMPRSAAVVQQCGIGTLAQGLRSGAPLLAVPFSHDQPDNAYRAAQLGVARVVAPTEYRAPRVARELSRLLDDPSYRSAATRVSAAVRAEGGVSAACEAIERAFFRA